MFKFSLFIFCFAALADGEVELPKVLYSIFKDKTPVCIGTLVQASSTTITLATAARCVLSTQPSRLSVLQGDAGFDYKKVQPVEKVIVHPYYTPPSADYDVALVKATPLPPTNEPSPLTPVIPSKTQPSPANLVSTANWDLKSADTEKSLENTITYRMAFKPPTYQSGGNLPPEELPHQESNITAIIGSIEERKSCKTKLENYINVSTKMICANVQSPDLKDGAPLLFNNKLAGLAVCSIKTNGKNLPKVFTNIANSEIYSFITSYM